MQTKVLWLGFSVPDDLARFLFSLDPMPAVQTHKFGWSFARSLRHVFLEVVLASSCPVQNYPLVNKLIFRRKFFKSNEFHGVLLGFVNVLFLKHVTRLVSCILFVTPIIVRQRLKLVFVHGLHTPYLIFALFTRFLGCRVVVVLTDPPGVMLATDSYVARAMKRIDVLLVRFLLRRVDAVIALAPRLVEQLAPCRPALLFPGILDSTLESPSISQTTDDPDGIVDTHSPFTVVYAGGLSCAYGVDRLLDAIIGFDLGESVRLKLYGRGDQVERIKNLALVDTRIEYGGFVSTELLLPELCSADVLINPRPTSEDFASMSFPSKLIEYLATGRPVLTTRIPSIPDELGGCFYYIDDESSEGIRAAIIQLKDMSVSSKSLNCSNAKQFVFSEFSEFATGQKIRKFVDCL